MTTDSDQALTVGILAGGTGRRLDGIDKGWANVGGRALIQHTLDRVSVQCDRLIINANRNLSAYRTLGLPVYPDADNDGGPLAGIEAVLRAATTERVLVVPIDTPLLPLDLAARLAAVFEPHTDVALARTPGGAQPLHVLLARRHCLTDLVAARANGIQSVAKWQVGLSQTSALFENEAAFANLNTPADLTAFEKNLDTA